MKTVTKLLSSVVLAASTLPAFAGVGVSVNIGEPGFFGRIDLGDSPRPEVYRDAPVVVDRSQYVDDPYYVRVPVAQQRNWRRYCGRYGACGRPVYFVKDDWYRNTYAPQYRERHGGGGHGGPRDDHGDGRRGYDRHGDDRRGGDHGDHGGDHDHH